ncbi:MAG: hypothetical protein WCF24_09765 [Acidimicrobiales bacterium]
MGNLRVRFFQSLESSERTTGDCFFKLHVHSGDCRNPRAGAYRSPRFSVVKPFVVIDPWDGHQYPTPARRAGWHESGNDDYTTASAVDCEGSVHDDNGSSGLTFSRQNQGRDDDDDNQAGNDHDNSADNDDNSPGDYHDDSPGSNHNNSADNDDDYHGDGVCYENRH